MHDTLLLPPRVKLIACTAPDGATFVGRAFDGVCTGTVTWNDGRVFVGKTSVDGVPIHGDMTSPNGTFYSGTFVGWGEDTGTLTFANGDVFQGQLLQFQPHEGTMTFAPRHVHNGKKNSI
jgi:hypothetical protein